MASCREATPLRVHRLGRPAGRWAGDDSELDVFAAERYFNEDDALWCARSSSSSSFSSAFRTGTHEHDRSIVTATVAPTSSSEASWNSRSALLSDGKVLATAMAAVPSVGAEQSGAGDERRRRKPSPPSSSHLRRWMLGVAGCACIGVHGGGGEEDSVSGDDDDEEEDDNVVGVGGQEEPIITNVAGELFERIRESEELAGEEAIAVRVMPGRWPGDGDEFLAGKAAFSPVQLAGNGPRRAAISAEFSTPFFNPATTAAVSHQQPGNSSGVLRQLGNDKSALVSTKQCSAFTIVAGNGALHAASGGNTAVPRRAPCISVDEDSSEVDAAPSELGCGYPPSEASVVWSVVTAEGAASCNFSSAASGYCYRHINGGEDDGAFRHDPGRTRSGIANSGGLLTCIGDKAVDAIAAATVGARNGGRTGARTCRR